MSGRIVRGVLFVLGLALIALGIAAGLRPVELHGRHTVRCGTPFVQDRHVVDQVLEQDPTATDPMVDAAACQTARTPGTLAAFGGIVLGVALVATSVVLWQQAGQTRRRRRGRRVNGR